MTTISFRSLPGRAAATLVAAAWILAGAACYDSGTPTVDNPRPAQACFWRTSVNERYHVFQDWGLGCAILSIDPDLGSGMPFRSSDGAITGAGLRNTPVIALTQTPCAQAITIGLLRDGLDTVSPADSRGWVRVQTPDVEAGEPVFLSASLDFRVDAGGPVETIRVLELEVTDTEVVGECPR